MHVTISGLVVLLALAGCGDDDPSISRSQSNPASEDACQSAPVRGYGFDTYGGWKGIARAATGRFRVEQVDGVWWLITPDGHAFFANGPTGVDTGDVARGLGRSPYEDAIVARHGSLDAWATHTLARLCDLGIRSLGGWMSAPDLDRFAGKLPYAVNVDFYVMLPRVRGGPAAPKPRHDVFAPGAAETIQAAAAPGGLVQRCAADPWCIGVYTENEVAYLPSLLNGGGHLDTYLSMAAGSPAKLAVQEFFAARYDGDIAAFNGTWETSLTSFDDLQSRTTIGACGANLGYEDDRCYFAEPRARFDDRIAFEAHVAGRMAQLGAAVVRSVHPTMLNLGPRIVVGPFAPAVLRALSAPADVMSVNNYDISALARDTLDDDDRARMAALNLLSFDPIERIRQLGAITGKPVLITEWFYRRARPGITSYPPFLPEVADGPAQAAAYRSYVESLLELPFVVGHHWFQWQDQPIQGRGDGENQLIGIVDIDDDLNQPLADTIRDVNASLIERRRTLSTHSGR